MSVVAPMVLVLTEALSVIFAERFHCLPILMVWIHQQGERIIFLILF